MNLENRRIGEHPNLEEIWELKQGLEVGKKFGWIFGKNL